MPTPFTHLALTQALLTDPVMPQAYRHWIQDHLPAFQLGAIAADARVANGAGRETTHFYSYDHYMLKHPAHQMLVEYPVLQSSHDDDQRAFIAGYVGHLATDEAWTLKMVRPNFFSREWHNMSRQDVFLALHLILIYMDERDEARLESWQGPSLLTARPDSWLPFIPDDALCNWRDLVGNQILPDSDSQTLKIFGDRIRREPQELRLLLDSEDEMMHRLWEHVPKDTLAQVESQFYDYTRDQIGWYLATYS